MNLKTAELRGLQTAWYDSGKPDADIVFFIHGYLDTPDTWEAQAAAFADKYRVILPMGRGIGESTAPASKRRYGAFSILLDHLEILRHVDPERKRGVHIVGHDIGGVHAWLLASHPYPNLKTATIINSVHPKQYLRRVFWPRQVLKSWYIAALQFPLVAEAALSMFHKEVLSSVRKEGWKPPDSGMTVEAFDQAALNTMNQYRQLVRDIPVFLRDATAPVALPVLVISSEEDRYLEAPTTYEFADIASNVTVRVVRGKHWVHREQPDRINRLLAEFWESHGNP